MDQRFTSYIDFEAAKIQCRECYVGHVYDTVVTSDGCISSPIVACMGEAPGSEEVACGKPFVGKAGKLLRKTLNEFGFRRNNTLITNVIPCRPDGNKFPSEDHIVESCTKRWLIEEMFITRPKFLLLLGSKPLKFVLHMDGISKVRGIWYRMEDWPWEAWAMPTFHPSYVERKKGMSDGLEIVGSFRKDIAAVAERAGFFQKDEDLLTPE